MEFECVQHDFLPTIINLTPHDVHVSEVEHSICTIKEQIWADIHSMPFRQLPKLMILELICRAVILLNQFPALNGVLKTLSPKTIMTGRPNLNYNSLKVNFGSYVLIFKDNDPTNTTKSRSTGAIVLKPTGNTKGNYHFMSLTTGCHLSCRQWTVLPMPDLVIADVEACTESEKQPLIEGGCPKFEWHPNIPISDDVATGLDILAIAANEHANAHLDPGSASDNLMMMHC